MSGTGEALANGAAASQELPDSLKAELRALPARYPQKRGALLMILHRIQEHRGMLAPADMKLAAEICGVSAAEVLSVVTFYTMYRQRPAGRFPLGVCRNIACWVSGSEKIVEAIGASLGIRPGETTKDGRFSLEEVECLGACGSGPCLEIDGRYFEHLTPQRVTELLARLAASSGDPGQAVLAAQEAYQAAPMRASKES